MCACLCVSILGSLHLVWDYGGLDTKFWLLADGFRYSAGRAPFGSPFFFSWLQGSSSPDSIAAAKEGLRKRRPGTQNAKDSMAPAVCLARARPRIDMAGY